MSNYNLQYIINLKKFMLVLFFSLSFVSNLSAQVAARSAAQTAKEILELHIQQAKEAKRLGYHDLAWQILLRADEFYDAYSAEYLNLKAQLLFDRGFLTQAKSIFENLLDDKVLSGNSERFLYELYLRNRNYDQITKLFANGLLQDSDAFFYQQLALYHTQDSALSNFSQTSLHRFNHDVRFLIPWLAASSEQMQMVLLDKLALLHDIVIKNLDDLILVNLKDQEILVGLIRQLPESLQMQVMQYLEPWLKNNINYQLLYRYIVNKANADLVAAQANNLEAELNLIEYEEPQWQNLEGNYLLMNYLTSLEDDALIVSKLPWAQDATMDGFADLIATVDAHGDGEVLYLPYQDDLVAQKVGYRKFIVENLVQSDSAVSVQVQFSRFPAVAQVNISQNSSLSYNIHEDDLTHYRYWLLFDAFSLPLNEQLLSVGQSVGLPEVAFDRQVNLLNVDFFSMSQYVDELRAEHHFRRIRRLNEREVQVWADTQMRGEFDHFMHMKDGKILYARRSFAGANDYTILELYENNELVSVAFSESGQNFDFYEELTGEYTFQIWDFDSDGYIDVYRRVQKAPLQPRERRAWLSTPVAINDMLLRSFDEARRWLEEIN